MKTDKIEDTTKKVGGGVPHYLVVSTIVTLLLNYNVQYICIIIFIHYNL